MGVILTVLAVVLICLYFAADSGLLALGQEYLERKFKFPRNVKTGAEGLVNRVADVTVPFTAASLGTFSGKVFVNGEIWNATAATPLSVGERARIVKVSGLLLEVTATAPPAE